MVVAPYGRPLSFTFDVVESNAATSNRIDDVREDLIPLITNPPTDLKRKVLILDEVHRFTNDAWDALLKWLEEPPPGIVFIFCTTDPSKIRPAILSRLQRFDFRPIAQEQIAAKLVDILKSEGRNAEPDAIALLARLADGGMRDAESMLDQLLSSGVDPLRAADVEELLGLPGAEDIARLASAALDADAAVGLGILADFELRGRDPRVVTERLTDLIRRALHAVARGARRRVRPGRRQAHVRGIRGPLPRLHPRVHRARCEAWRGHDSPRGDLPGLQRHPVQRARHRRA